VINPSTKRTNILDKKLIFKTLQIIQNSDPESENFAVRAGRSEAWPASASSRSAPEAAAAAAGASSRTCAFATEDESEVGAADPAEVEAVRPMTTETSWEAGAASGRLRKAAAGQPVWTGEPVKTELVCAGKVFYRDVILVCFVLFYKIHSKQPTK
jgi:hypothetical protein